MANDTQRSETLEQMLGRPWSMEIVGDGDVFAARVPELPGCFSEGATREEALGNVQDALESWLSAALEYATEIPTPRGETEPEDVRYHDLW